MAHRFEDYDEHGARPWLDRSDAEEALQARLARGEIGTEEAGWLRRWMRDGYVVFEGVLDHETADEINAHVDEIVAATAGRPVGEIRKEFENVYVHSEAVRRAICLPSVFERLDLLLGMYVIPHQTLNMPISSQQGAHSDQVLMSTHPPGYMAAVWFALEDIGEESGPLVVFPGSHRLPYVSAQEIGIPRGVSEEECARIYDANYYDRIKERIEESGIQAEAFLPRKGDILIWHSNLLHGANLVTGEGATRRSLIAHYFGIDTEHYSDLFQRACLSPDLRPRGS